MISHQTSESGAEKGAGKTIRVAMIDDHPLVRTGLEHLLSNESDLELCGSAPTVPLGLRLIAQKKPDLVILDLSLDDGNGLQLADFIQKKKLKKPLLLVVSMHEESRFGPRCYEAGAKGYLNKQLAPERLLAAIRHVAHGGTCFSDDTLGQFIEADCACGNRLRAHERLAGKSVPCPICKAKVALPAAQVDDDDILEILGEATPVFETPHAEAMNDTAELSPEEVEAPEQTCPSCGFHFRGTSSMCPQCHKFTLDLSHIE